MKVLLVQAVVAAFVVLIVAAVVFRSTGARGMLGKLRDGIVLYVILIFLLGMFTYFRGAF
ncbi:MAG: hypothetical protein ACKVT1_05760 [Dehalococcoidia bacterium]